MAGKLDRGLMALDDTQFKALLQVKRGVGGVRQCDDKLATARAELERAVYDATEAGVPARQVSLTIDCSVSNVYMMKANAKRAMEA